MRLDKGVPGGPLSRVTAFGAPWHGELRNGVLTLPNAETMPYPQPPTSNNAIGWLQGACNLVRRPGWAPTPRTPDELAADVAAGREWRDYALLSGSSRQYAGQSLSGGWVWFGPDGAYRVNSTGAAMSAEGIVLAQFRLTPFGRIGGDPGAPIDVNVPAYSPLQSGAPAVNRRATAGGGMTLVALDEQTDFRPVSIAPDGSKALYMVSVEHYAPQHTSGIGSTMLNRPVGFVEVTINQDFTISAQTIRSRAQCLGTYTFSVPESPPPPFGTDVAPRTVLVRTEAGPWIDLPACGQGGIPQERFVTPVADEFLHGDVVPPGNWVQYGTPQTGSWWRKWDSAIVAMWYDADGALHEISATVRIDLTATVSSTHVLTGERREFSQCDANGSLISGLSEGDIRWALSDQTNLNAVLRLVLLDNGVEIPGSEWVSTETDDYDVTVNGVVLGGETTFTWDITTANSSNRMDQDGTTSVNVASGVSDTSGAPASTVSPLFVLGMPLFSGLFGQQDWSALRFDVMPYFLPHYTAADSTVGPSQLLDFVRWSPTALGYRTQRQSQSGVFTVVLDQHRFGDVVTPGGVLPHTETITTAGVQSRVIVCGSWQPVTGQWATGVSTGVVASPVVWV